MTPTAARDLSNRLSADEPERALTVARGIQDPWFRCQALAHVGRYWPDQKYGRLLEEAVKAGDLQADLYKQVTVSAWPIRAYLERGSVSPAQKLLVKYTRTSSGIENMGSRSEALFMLFQAARPFGLELWQPVYWALVGAAEPALSWRQRRNLREAVAMVVSSNPALVQQTIRRLADQKNISVVQGHLDNPRPAEPRPFFWQHAQ